MVGTFDSTIALFDTRMTQIEVQSKSMDVARIRRLKRLEPIPAAVVEGGKMNGSSGNKGLMAVISDHPVLNLIKESSLSCVYQGSAMHTGWIRDVIVVSGQVFSIGHGHQELVKHHLMF